MTSARDFGLVVTRTSGAEENCICPFHHDQNSSASWNREKELFYCYVCNLGLNLAQLMEHLNLQMDWDMEREDREPAEYDLVGEEQYFELGVAIASGYYTKRHISEETRIVYELGWKSSQPAAAVLPVRRLNGKLCGAVYRFVRPELSGTRYMKVGKMQPVWPMPMLQRLQSDGKITIVCEGAWSAMRIHTFMLSKGYEAYVFALLGAKANQSILDVMCSFNPVFLYDNDKAGFNACNKMRKLSPTTHAFTTTKSPDEMDDEEINDFLCVLERRVMK